jgi:4-hydroxy-tetrahydrodipicolinate synthase|tara:strand:- start:50 stop:934 length:885 start_codon:yes stop_codon:yes gene_type:complete
MALIRGIYAASMSILKEDLSLDVEKTILHSENLIKQGCHGVAIFGSTGQSQLISTSEKIELISVLSNSKYKSNFILGTGSNSLLDTIKLMNHAKKNGLDKFLLMPPAYYKYDDEGAYLFYAKIIENIKDCKIILYNFEKLNGYKFSVDCVKNLAKDFPDQIIGVKDSTYNLYEKLKIPNFSVMPGSELKLLEGLEIGCTGIITATCNVTATLSRKVFDDFENKNAQTVNEKLCKVRRVFDKYNLISALHSYKSINQSFFKRVLPPLKLLDEKQHKELVLELKKLNFISEDSLAA